MVDLRKHYSRLETLLSFSISDAPETQIRALAQDARIALGAEYVHLARQKNGRWVQTYERTTEGKERIGDEPSPSLAAAYGESDRPLMIYDASDEPAWRQKHLLENGLRSLLAWPGGSPESRWVLAFGWPEPRRTYIAEDEIRYLDSLAQILSRLIDMNDKQQELRDRVMTDTLTSLLNAAATRSELSRLVSAAERNESSLAVLYLDLDGFKQVNDTMGHTFGDITLADVADRMRGVLRKHEIAGRIGGDEFCIIVSAFTDDGELQVVAKRILSAVASTIAGGTPTPSLSGSIGIAVYPRDGTTADELIEHADAAMYCAKRQSTGRFAFYGAEPAAAAVRQPFHIEPETDMGREYVLCYQPIIDSRTERVIAAEVLTRWLHPTKGLLLPEAFLNPGRDDSAMRLDRWVVATALNKGIPGAGGTAPLALHVNISEADDSLLEEHAGSSTPVCLEIAEEAILRDTERYTAFVKLCRDRGFAVGISNFGSIGLSLRVLAALSIDFVKIGKGVVPDAPTGTRPAAVAKGIIDQAHSMGWTVIAETVESASQRDWVIRNGVDALQGYAISSPLTDRDFQNWMRYRGSA